MRTLSNTGDPLVSPDGTVLSGIAVTFILCNASGVKLDGWIAVSGERVAGEVSTVTDANGEFTVSLWENDKFGSVTQYRCHVAYSGINDFIASVPTGLTTLKWIDFFANGTPLTPTEISALANHMSDAAVHLAATLPNAGLFPKVNPAGDGFVYVAGGGGVTDHLDLDNIGTRTHDELESDIADKEAVGVAAAGDSDHLVDFTHADIAHGNRVALDAVAGTNTGDQTTVSGNAGTVSDIGNLTGVVTSTNRATAIADAALPIAKTSGLQGALDGKQASLGFTAENAANKDQNNGYAGLDGGGKIPAALLPSSVMAYHGNWNASTNSPSLSNGAGDAGDVYLVSVAGTRNFGAGNITFKVGDWAVYSGSVWEKSLNSNEVVSVNSYTGAVVLVKADVGLDNVDNTSNVTERAASATLTSKTIALGDNTVSGTIAQFNTALTDGDFATGGGTVTGASSGTNTGDNAGVTAVTGTGAIASSGGTTPAISIVAATPSVPGSMSAVDKTKLDDATAAATNNTLVLRNGSGNFSAGTITATLSGNASGLSSTLAVGSGGTGQTSFTDTGVLIGNAGGLLQVTAAGIQGHVLTANAAGSDPTFQAAAGAVPDFLLQLQGVI